VGYSLLILITISALEMPEYVAHKNYTPNTGIYSSDQH